MIKKMIAHPEWDRWFYLLAIVPLLLTILIWQVPEHGIVLRSNGRMSAGIFLVLFGVIITVITLLDLFEAISARRFLVQASRNETIQAYLSIKASMLLLLLGALMMWMRLTPATIIHPVNPYVTDILIPGFLLFTGFSLIRRSCLSPWAVPRLEISHEGIALLRPRYFKPGKSFGQIKNPGTLGFIAWDNVQKILWIHIGPNDPPRLCISAQQAVWFNGWMAYWHHEQPVATSDTILFESILVGISVPPDAIVLIAQQYIEKVKKTATAD